MNRFHLSHWVTNLVLVKGFLITLLIYINLVLKFFFVYLSIEKKESNNFIDFAQVKSLEPSVVYLHFLNGKKVTKCPKEKFQILIGNDEINCEIPKFHHNNNKSCFPCLLRCRDFALSRKLT